MKVLVVRFSSIGDIVLTTPVVRCLKEQLNAEVHFLTKNAFKGIVDTNPNVDKVYAIQKGLNDVLGDLKSEEYDYVVDLHSNLRTRILKFKLRKPAFTFDKLNFKKWLLVRFKMNKMPDVHIVERYLETVNSLGVVNDQKGLSYYIPEKDKVEVSTINQVVQSGNYLSIVIGAAHFTKRIPIEMIVKACEGVNVPVLLLGGKGDKEKGDEVLQAVSRDNVFNTCGQFNLNQSASIVEQSLAVVSADTGLMHIASAFKKKIISIWGNTVPELGMYPYLPLNVDNFAIIENNSLSCRPCSKIGFQACPKGHFKCMNDIEVQDIIDSFHNLTREL